MRAKSIATVILASMVLAASTAGAGNSTGIYSARPSPYFLVTGLPAELTDEDLSSFSGPMYKKYLFNAGDADVLVITRERGSGIDLRDIHLYSGSKKTSWQLMTYVRPVKWLADPIERDGQIIITNTDGAELMEVSVNEIIGAR
jgi:hypothetical protein